MRASVFVGASVDGFIARANGELDWLPENPEDHGYNEFFASVDALVIGRGTFETVLSFGEWPYGKKKVVVLSTRTLDFSSVKGANVVQMSGTPGEIVAKLEREGVGHVYVDGGITIQRFLRAGLIQRLIVTRVPVLIGSGIPLFGVLDGDVRLKHVSTRSFPSGLVQTEYEVATEPSAGTI
jgi:dihydrofolate reductase